MGRPETTCSEIRSWSYPRKSGVPGDRSTSLGWGQRMITQSARGSRVEIGVRLGRAASRMWSTTVVFGGIAVLYVAMHIVEAFLSGRAQQFLASLGKVAN